MKSFNGVANAGLSNKAQVDLYYAMPRIAVVSLYAPMNIVQGIYAKHYGLALTTIAGVILFARLLDAITDPLMGYLSDQSRLKHGTRKPAMILGALLMVISGYFLYSPPDTVTVFYFAFWFIAFFLGLTLFEIPHLAWGGEIVHEAHAKTQTYNLRIAAGYLGLVLFYSLPLLPIWESTYITPDKLHFSAVVSGLLMLPLLYFCMKRVPNGSCYSGEQATVKQSGRTYKIKINTFRNTIKSVIHNKPLLLFLGAFILVYLGFGMWASLLFIFVDVYLDMGASFSEIYLVSAVVGIVATLLWIRVARRIGKKNTWIVAMLLGITSFAYTGLLGPENTGYGVLLILLIINTLCSTCVDSLPLSMLSDIVDYSTLKFRVYRGSTYFALFLFIGKGAAAVGSALGLTIAGWYGFDATAASQTQAGVQGLKTAMVWLPILFTTLSLVFISFSPITLKRHSIIRRRLDALEARSKRQEQKIKSDSVKSEITMVTSTS